MKFPLLPSLEKVPTTSILKRVGIVKENTFYAAWLLKMRNIEDLTGVLMFY